MAFMLMIPHTFFFVFSRQEYITLTHIQHSNIKYAMWLLFYFEIKHLNLVYKILKMNIT